MEVLYSSPFVEISFDKANSLIIDKFLSGTKLMKNEDFQKEMLIFVSFCKEHSPLRELVHLVDMNYMIIPEMQEWMNETIFPQYENIIKRMAFLMPENFITQLSVEQTMQEEVGQKFVLRYFVSEELALKWLLF